MSGFFDSFTKSPGSSSRRSKEAATPQQRQTALTRADAPITPSSLLSPIATEAEREQALRDYKVTIEYKHLKNHAPAGVYLVPSLDALRLFHGVIFVRRGPYTNGIFKFQLHLPPKYNDVDTWPRIIFSSSVYSPHVDAKTGELDIRSTYPSWDPHRHYLVTVLTYLKKIFYLKAFPDGPVVANPEARDLAVSDQAAYRKNVDACVRESQKSVFVNNPGCTTRFTEDEACHVILRGLMKKRLNDPASMTRSQVLEMVQASGSQAAAQAAGGS